jgi:hypothetical protein
MYADLRPKLTGAYYFDIDGVASGPFVYLNLARRADLPSTDTRLLRAYVSTPEARHKWHVEVAKFYLFHSGRDITQPAVEEMAAEVKRWPTKLANGSRPDALLRDAGLAPVTDLSQHDKKRLLPLARELRLLKTKLLHADCNRAFVERHQARIKRDAPGITDDKLDKRVFALLAFTEEDAILQKSVEVARRLNRDAVGADAFDARPAETRDGGALVYDGCMLELHPEVANDVDDNGRMRLLAKIEGELAALGVEYKLAVKPNFGKQHEPVPAAVAGRAALRDAMARHSDVRAAVDALGGQAGGDDMDDVDDVDDDELAAAAAAAEAAA